jgi:hypothetical protein
LSDSPLWLIRQHHPHLFSGALESKHLRQERRAAVLKQPRPRKRDLGAAQRARALAAEPLARAVFAERMPARQRHGVRKGILADRALGAGVRGVQVRPELAAATATATAAGDRLQGDGEAQGEAGQVDHLDNKVLRMGMD